MLTYHNTPSEAARIGWDRLPEYCEGDSSLPFVRHDTRRGVFIYTDEAGWLVEVLTRAA